MRKIHGDEYLENVLEELVMDQWFLGLGVGVTHVCFVHILFCCVSILW